MDKILIILKKASSAPALGLNTIIFKHVYWYMQQISGERLQDHWSSGLTGTSPLQQYEICYINFRIWITSFVNVKSLPKITFKH